MHFKVIAGSIPKLEFPLISKDVIRLQLVPSSIRILFILVKEIIISWILQVIEQVISLLITGQKHAGGVIDPPDLHLDRPEHVFDHVRREIVHPIENEFIFYWVNFRRGIIWLRSFVEEISVYAGSEMYSEELEYEIFNEELLVIFRH
jgi:hypothetical protein